MSEALVLYDGVCGLCNKSVQFILARDPAGRFAYCPLQSRMAVEMLERHGMVVDFDSFLLVENPGQPDERVLSRFRAARAVSMRLGSFWGWLGRLSLLVPAFVGDVLYRFIARRRYAWFGKADACLLPSPEQRTRFMGFDQLEPDAVQEPPAAA